MRWRKKKKRKTGPRFRGWGDLAVDASMLGVPIVRADGSPVTDFRSHDRWRQINRGANEDDAVDPIPVKDLLREKHHQVYGSPWIGGRLFADVILAQGIARDARLLDIGCGGGRIGRWLVEALEPGCYFGIDPHLRSLVAFSAYELKLANLVDKQPRLLLDTDFRFDAFGVRFDASVDVWVSKHLSPDVVARVYSRLHPLLAPGACVVVQGYPGDRHLACLETVGYRREAEKPIEWPAWVGRPREKPAEICHIFRPA